MIYNMLCSYCISCGHGQQDRGSASVCTWAHLVHNSRAWSMCEERIGYCKRDCPSLI